MTRSRRVFAFAVLLAAALPLAAAQVVSLGVTDDAISSMTSILQHVNSAGMVDVQLKEFSNHDELYKALKDGRVDLAFLGAVKYVEAHYDFAAVPLVSEAPNTRSFIVVPAGSPLRNVAELKGKRFAFGYEDSTTTHLIPALLLSKHGIKESDVKGSYVGHHPQKLIDDMLAGKFDAAGVSEITVDQNKGKIRVLESSDAFPGPPIVARPGLPEGVKTVIRLRFASYKPSPSAQSERFAKGALAVTDPDYNRIRFLCKVLFNKMYQ